MSLWIYDMTAKYVKTITTFFICVLLLTGHFLIANINLANDGSLENQPLKYEWGLEEQSPKYEQGLEDLTPKHDKSDSIILHYNGKAWDCIYNGHGIWLNSIYGFNWDDIFAVGDNGVILHYDGINCR